MKAKDLVEFRESKGWTQAEMATQLNSSLMYIQLLEKGEATIQGRVALEIQHASGIQLLDEQQLVKIYGHSHRQATIAGECLDAMTHHA